MTLVVDASVAVKWVLPEQGADRAAALRNSAEELIAPDLILAEVGNTACKYVGRRAQRFASAFREQTGR